MRPLKNYLHTCYTFVMNSKLPKVRLGVDLMLLHKPICTMYGLYMACRTIWCKTRPIQLVGYMWVRGRIAKAKSNCHRRYCSTDGKRTYRQKAERYQVQLKQLPCGDRWNCVAIRQSLASDPVHCLSSLLKISSRWPHISLCNQSCDLSSLIVRCST